MTRTLLVTGGSGGIGAATARLAAKRGYDVAVHFGGNEAAAEKVAADVRKAGRRAITVKADVADSGQIRAMFAASAVAFDTDNPLTALRLGEHPDPVAEDGWVVVDVRAASVNHHDVWTLKGVGISQDRLPIPLPFPQPAQRLPKQPQLPPVHPLPLLKMRQ